MVLTVAHTCDVCHKQVNAQAFAARRLAPCGSYLYVCKHMCIHTGERTDRRTDTCLWSREWRQSKPNWAGAMR